MTTATIAQRRFRHLGTDHLPGAVIDHWAPLDHQDAVNGPGLVVTYSSEQSCVPFVPLLWNVFGRAYGVTNPDPDPVVRFQVAYVDDRRRADQRFSDGCAGMARPAEGVACARGRRHQRHEVTGDVVVRRHGGDPP